jgi:hypothetical protein
MDAQAQSIAKYLHVLTSGKVNDTGESEVDNLITFVEIV